ncbi:MAG TPA: aminopeptidase N C-terminal domain-containing protein, partial [Burkholderiaceae bacterium]|nr:aminopeptidase N C-terminal domain-containing protein [Burkholderiaceae bacterium]
EIRRHLGQGPGPQANKVTEATPGQTLSGHIIQVWRQLLEDPALAPDYRARALQLISRKQMLLRTRPIDPQAVCQAHALVHAGLGEALADQWLTAFESCADVASRPYSPDSVDAGKRALRSVALAYLLAGGHDSAIGLAREQYWQANNLTDRLGALNALSRFADKSHSQDILADFFDKAHLDEQVMDTWFSVQANAHWADVEFIERLAEHPVFSLRNPNRARALIFQFCLNNLAAIHRPQGYDFWTRQILALDALNPEIAARLARGLDNWAQYAEPARTGMRRALETLRNSDALSPNVGEIVDKALTIQAE